MYRVGIPYVPVNVLKWKLYNWNIITCVEFNYVSNVQMIFCLQGGQAL